MGALRLIPLFLCVGLALAVSDPILRRSDGLRYEYLPDSDGVPHLVDSWLKLSDLAQMARFNPDVQNQYHLFTRQNPTVSQPLVHGNLGILTASNFDAQRKTVFLIHGWLGSATASSNTVLVPAVLAGEEDVNAIVLDWSVGAALPSFPNALLSAQSVARFINWLNVAAGVSNDNVVLVGFSLGAQQAGMVGRYTDQTISYISALDPPKRGYEFEFKATDAAYTEVINTNVNAMGTAPLGHVDFYPNGGDENPGCGGDHGCNHARAYFFMAESIVSGGFTGVQCQSYQHALNGTCDLPGRLSMGGLTPKTGSTGIFFLTTNAAPPFSKG